MCTSIRHFISNRRNGQQVGVVDSVSASHVVSSGFDRVIPKAIIKMVQIASLLGAKALVHQFDTVTRQCKRPGSVWNCLWGHALKRSPGINRKSRLSYPDPGFISSSTWSLMPKKQSNISINQSINHLPVGIVGIKHMLTAIVDVHVYTTRVTDSFGPDQPVRSPTPRKRAVHARRLSSGNKDVCRRLVKRKTWHSWEEKEQLEQIN